MGYKRHSIFLATKEICEKGKQNVILHKCHICFEGFEDSHLLELHIFLCHSVKTANEVVEKDRPENGSTNFRDELAKKDNTESDDSFDLKLQRRKNLENKDDDETENCISEKYLCDTCDKIFNESDNFLTHSVNEHGFKAEEISYDCGSCYKSFAKIALFRKHIKMISKKENIFVNNYEFPNIKGAVQQRSIHSKKCEICGKSLNAQYLKIHISTVHQEANIHPCEICKKIFTGKYRLNEHIRRVHQKSKCVNCGKSFYKHYLKLHISTVHEGARKFECKNCKINFSQKASLNLHIKKSITKSKCDICGKSYCSDYTLRKHMNAVHKQYQKKEQKNI